VRFVAADRKILRPEGLSYTRRGEALAFYIANLTNSGTPANKSKIPACEFAS
jgi:hypothetical protein